MLFRSVLDISRVGKVADGVAFFGEDLRLVEGEPARRPAVVKVGRRTFNGDTIPMFVAGKVVVARFIEDGDEEFAGSVGW